MSDFKSLTELQSADLRTYAGIDALDGEDHVPVWNGRWAAGAYHPHAPAQETRHLVVLAPPDAVRARLLELGAQPAHLVSPA